MAPHHDSERSSGVRRRHLLRAAAGAGVASLASFPATGRRQFAGGAELWRFETGDSVTAAATVVDGTVYTGSFDEHVYALDAETGRQQWRSGTNSPVAWDPSVVDHPDDDGRQLFAGTLGRLYALDPATGTEQWQLDTAAAAQVPSPSVWGERVVFSDQNVSGVSRVDGIRRWRNLTRGSVVGGWLQLSNSSPTVVPADRLGDWSDEDTVFVGSTDGAVYAYEPGDGDTEGIYEVAGPIVSSPTAWDGTVYVGSLDSSLYALDPSINRAAWRFETGDGIVSSPTVHDGTVYVGSGDGSVYAVDAASGDELWAFTAGGAVQSSPTVAGGAVFVGSEDGHVYAVDAAEGEAVWRYDTGDPVRSSPIVVDGVLFVGSWNGSVYALDAGVAGSSQGSRVELGTLGHHHAFVDDSPQALSTAADGAVHTPEAYEAPTGTDDSADDGGAGLGPLAALGGLGGAGYLLRRSLGDDRREE